MAKSELKDVILELYEQQCELNTVLAEKDRLSAEKDLQIASLSGKLDTLIASQNQVRLEIDSWLAKEREWNKERQGLLKTISDLKDLIQVLKKAKFKGTK